MELNLLQVGDTFYVYNNSHQKIVEKRVIERVTNKFAYDKNGAKFIREYYGTFIYMHGSHDFYNSYLIETNQIKQSFTKQELIEKIDKFDKKNITIENLEAILEILNMKI